MKEWTSFKSFDQRSALLVEALAAQGIVWAEVSRASLGWAA